MGAEISAVSTAVDHSDVSPFAQALNSTRQAQAAAVCVLSVRQRMDWLCGLNTGTEIAGRVEAVNRVNTTIIIIIIIIIIISQYYDGTSGSCT